ncbi:MAG: bifunctional metallophosphatase/5'-nucleotidase [Clostridiales bacterium]|nr:bifunctional metallophosphatase/5'-nucleotidase [Candidatus Apopatocola equi]MCQ2439916.1 bifunctional metallophosphatase/5'-nucleotidase [Oscillospiraceae bacterium]
MKRTFALLLALCMVLSLCACGGTKEEAKTQEPAAAPAAETAAVNDDIVILYTNDVHCGVEDGLTYQGIAAVKAGLEAAGKTVLLVDCGDHSQGGTIGTLSKGEYIIDIMNEVGYALAIPGNHEFDYGMDQFLANVEHANFPYLSCNFVGADDKSVLEPYALIEVNGVKLGFVGISTPETVTKSTPTYFQNEDGEYIYFFCQDTTGEKLYAAVQNAVDAVRAEGADYVIALAHLGIDTESSPWMSTEVIGATTGIDVVLDGHSHSTIEGDKVANANGEDVLLTSTGTKLDALGCLTLNADGTFTSKLVDNKAAAAKVDEINAEFDELINTVVAHTDVDLITKDPETGSRVIRSQETNLGDLCADAYRAMSGADIAIVNGGGIRADIPAGDITYGQIITVHPFGNEMCMCEVTGAELLDALELSAASLPGEFGGFLQVSGMTFTIDMSVEPSVVLDENQTFVEVAGERRVKDVMIGGEPIDTEKTYTLASHNYKLKSGGDGYGMFKDNNFLLDCVMIDNQVLINYIVEKLNGTVGEDYADIWGQGRITIING